MIPESKKVALEVGAMATSGHLLAKVVSVPLGLYVASVLGPSGYGVLAMVVTVAQYMGYANLGMLTNLTREVPMAYGRGDKVAATRIYGVVAFNYALATLVSLGVFWVFFAIGNVPSGLTLVHAVLLTVIVVTANSESYFYSVLKGEGRFVLYGRYEFVRPVVTPVSNAVMVWAFGLSGMIASIAVQHMIGFGFLVRFMELPPLRLRIDLAETRRLMSTGLKMYFNKILDGLFTSTAIVLGLRYLSPAEVGILSFSLGALAAGKVPFATIIGVTIDRQIMLIAGRAENRSAEVIDPAQFRRFFETPFAVYLLWLTLVVGCFALFYGYAVQVFLTEFRAAVWLLPVLFLGLTFYNARTFALSYIDGTRQMGRRSRAMLIGILANACGCLVVLALGWKGLGLAVALSFSMVVVSLQLLIPVLREVGAVRSGGRFVVPRLVLLLLFLAVVVAGLIHISPTPASAPNGAPGVWRWGASAADLGARMVLFATISYAGFALMFRGVGLHEEVSKLVRHGMSRIRGWRMA